MNGKRRAELRTYVEGELKLRLKRLRPRIHKGDGRSLYGA